PAERTASTPPRQNMKSPLAHLSPTVLAFGAAIGVSLSVYLLSGAALQGEAIPLLPALRGAAESVAVDFGTSENNRRVTPAKTGVSRAQPAVVPTAHPVAAPPTAHRAQPGHHARPRARARAARPAPSPQVRVPVSAPAPGTPAPAPAPQPVS